MHLAGALVRRSSRHLLPRFASLAGRDALPPRYDLYFFALSRAEVSHATLTGTCTSVLAGRCGFNCSRADDQACRRLLKAFMPADEKDATAAVVRHLERAAAARGVPLWEAARESLGAKVEPPSTLPVTFVSPNFHAD